MPRQARLDAPGVLHHIMIRGIKRRKIFVNDRDREDFVERLSKLLPQTETACYAWVFIPNHVTWFRVKYLVQGQATAKGEGKESFLPLGGCP